MNAGERPFRADGGDVRAGGEMGLDHGAHIHVGAEVAAGQEDVFLPDLMQMGADRVQRLHAAAVDALSGVPETVRRQKVQPAVRARHVPWPPAAEVLHQREIAALHDDAHVENAGVHQPGHRKVDEPVAAAEGQRRAGALASELAEGGKGVVSVNDAVNVFHARASSPV